MSGIDQGDEVGIDQQRAARHIDHVRSSRQAGKYPAIEKTARLIGKRKKADQDAASRQKGIELGARKHAYTSDLLARPAPACHGKTERDQRLGYRAAEHP